MSTNRSFKLKNQNDVNVTEPARGFRLLPTSNDLVRQARSGDRGALGALHDMHAADVRSFMSERVPDTLLDDACQDVWVAVFEEIEGYEEERAPFGPWLLSIAERWCWKLEAALEAERNMVPLDSVASELVAPAPEIDAIDADELRRDMASALESVPDREREAFLLAHEPLTPDEIAIRMGMTEEAAEALVVRCAARLRRLLGKYDGRNQ